MNDNESLIELWVDATAALAAMIIKLVIVVQVLRLMGVAI